jgi:ABC-2 type transport system permease protein
VSGVRQGWLVAKRELRERSRSRAFLASLVIMVAAVVAAIALPGLIDGSGGSRDVGLTGVTPAALGDAIAAQGQAVGTEIDVRDYDTLVGAEQAVRNGSVDVLVVDADRLEWQGRADEQLEAIVTAAIQISAVQGRADAAGMSAGDLDALLAPVAVDSVELGHVAGRSPDDETAAFIMTVVLFMTIATYGAMVLSGVVEEKSSRVVEVLLSRIPARSLLAGKITGIGLLGLGQVAVTALAALVAATTISDVDLPAVRGSVLLWAVVWFVLGYALYATVFGALGSLASRPEDAQSVAGPVSVVLVLVYFVSFAAIGSPDTTWARVIAWLPITAPIAMPTRIAMGAAAWAEPVLAAALTAATIAGLVVVGGRVYAAAVLHDGPTLTLRDTWQRARPSHPARHLDGSRPAGIADSSTVGDDGSHGTSVARTGRGKTVAVALVAALALVALTVALSGDVIVGVAVGTATYAVIDRISTAWGGPNEPSAPGPPAERGTEPTTTHNT